MIPTRNRVDLTLAAVRSVQRQTYADWEAYVVDDASDDGSSEALEASLRDDDRIHVVALGENLGEGGARHQGFLAGTGQLVATLDSDDVWLPDKLERQVDQLAVGSALFRDVGSVLCGHCWTDEDLVPLRDIVQPPIYSRSALVSNNMSTLVVQRDVLIEAGGFTPGEGRTFKNFVNVDTYVRLASVAGFVAVQGLLVLCRMHPGARQSDSLSDRASAASLAELLSTRRAYLETCPNDDASLRAHLGALLLAGGEAQRGLAEMRAALALADRSTRRKIVRRYGRHTVRHLLRTVTAGRLRS